MDWTHYRFRARWDLPVPPAVVYPLLERAEDYPRWWPQVRGVDPIDDTSGVISIRASLPYVLTFTAREVRRDPVAGVLEIAMTGDLEGWARWTLTAEGPGTRASYDQEVDLNRQSLRRFAAVGRPVFRFNHALMMRAGRRGLLAYLEAA